MTKHNFSAGPSILRQEVMQKASEAAINFDGMDLSILEISHRSKEFMAVAEETESLVRKNLSVPDNYKVLVTTK